MEQPNLPVVDRYKKYFKSMEPVFESEGTKRYSTVIFFFLVLSVFGWYAIRPTLQTILYLNREISDKTELTKKMDDKLNALIEANSNLEAAQDRLPLLTDAIPPSPEALTLVQNLQTIAREYGASISALQITDVTLSSPSALGVSAKKEKQTYPITVTLNSSFPSLSAFLDDIVNLRRIMTVDGLSVTPVKSESSRSAQTTLKTTIKLTAYFGTL